MSPLEQAVAEHAERAVLHIPDEERPTRELRFEHDLALKNLEELDLRRERLMARAFRLSLMLERRGG